MPHDAEKLWKRITGLFGEDPDTGDFDDFLKNWLKSIGAEKYSDSYRGDNKIIYDIIASGRDARSRLLNELPEKLGMGKSDEWETDRSDEFIARLDRALFHMSVMKYIELKENGDPDEKREFITSWFAKLLCHLEFTTDEAEQFLEKYLEEIADN